MDTRTQGDGADYPGIPDTATAATPAASTEEKTEAKLKLKLDASTKRLLVLWQKKRAESKDHSVFLDLKDADDFALEPPDIPRDRLIPIYPTKVIRKPAKGGEREPKFVPYEPYKASITPLVPTRPAEKATKPKADKNNLDLNVLVSQISEVTETEMKKTRAETEVKQERVDEGEEMKALRRQVEELQKERKYFEGQLNFQARVNGELKTLLVAAVGEDIHDRVNLLTEDKLHLARALLSSAKDLSTHTEQIEFLAGQSEVWRSKFLASSLMVEELARWKTSLSQKNDQLVIATRQLLETMGKVRERQVDILQNLNFLGGNRRPPELQSATVVDLANESVDLSQRMVLQHSKMGIPNTLELGALEHLTEAEKFAMDALQSPQQPLMSTEEAFRAIMGQAFPSINSLRRQREEILAKDEVIVDETKEEEAAKK